MIFGVTMRYKRVLFIIPNLKGFYGWPSYPHPGLGYISTFLEIHGIEYEVLDMNLGYQVRAVKKKIKSFAPELIAMTLYTYKHSQAYELIARVKKDFDIPIVVGGPHVSLYGTKVFREDLIDFAIRHEGERDLLALCMGKNLGEIPNLLYSNNGNLKENPGQPFYKDLDELPFPQYSQFELDKYGAREIGIVSSRGCPYHCIYCPIMTTMGRNFRPRSPQNILSELKYWYEKGYRSFEFVDDAFLQDNERVYQICDLIEKEKLNNLSLGCSQGIRANKINRPLLERMRGVGFGCLGFGVESASDRILKSIKKGQTFKQIDEAVKVACELGYDVRLFFMIGFPKQTVGDVEKSFQFALKYPVTFANFYNIIPYPGTELFDYLEKKKLFLVAPETYLNEVITRTREPVFKTSSMSISERKKALKRGYKISRQISWRHRKRQYKKLGILGEIVAWLLTTSFIYHKIGMIKRNKAIYFLWRSLTKERLTFHTKNLNEKLGG